MRVPFVIALAIAFLPGICDAQSGSGREASHARGLIVRGLEFMGGEERVRGVRTRKSTYTEISYALGQEPWPGAVAPLAGSIAVEINDYTTRTFRRALVPPGASTSRAVSVVTRDSVGMLVLQDTIRRRIAGAGSVQNAARIARASRLRPEAILLAALDARGDQLRPLRQQHKSRDQTLSGVRLAAGADTVDLWFDSDDGRLVAIEQTVPDPIFGVRVESHQVGGWTQMGDTRLATTVESTANGVPMRRSVAFSTDLNSPAVDSLPALPSDFTMLSGPREGVSVVELAPGISRLEGGSGVSLYGGGIPYFSFAIQQGDSTLLIELPVSDERAKMVLDTARSRWPTKPVRALVVTHAHLDHISGSRTAFDAGIRVLSPRGVAPFLGRVGLSAGEKPRVPRKIVPVDDSLSVGSGDQRFTLYRIRTNHVRDMLLAYFPAQKLIIESDMQGAATPSEQRELLAFVRARGLGVTRIAGTHGPAVTWEQFATSLK